MLLCFEKKTGISIYYGYKVLLFLMVSQRYFIIRVLQNKLNGLLREILHFFLLLLRKNEKEMCIVSSLSIAKLQKIYLNNKS